MVTPLLTEKYQEDIYGTLHCYDRVVIAGHLQPLCYPKGMAKYLSQHGIRIFNYAQFAEPLRNLIRGNAETIAKENGLTIEFISKKDDFRKEERIKSILQSRGTEQPGLVHIFSAMERCQTYQPWHDKETNQTYLKMRQGKCLHYYFYFIDPELGVCYLRVSTWSPFRLQFYFNGHNALVNHLQKEQIAFVQEDNAFLALANVERANDLATRLLDMEAIHHKLNTLTQLYCPVVTQLALEYRWSIMQAEYATDIIFKSQSTLQMIYLPLLEILIQAVKPADIATFLGRKLHSNYQDEMGNRLNKRWLGTRLKHQMGSVSIKMYDKFSLVLRIETTVNDVSFFPHYRQVVHRDGTTVTKFAPMKKTIYSLPPLADTLQAVNQRYLKFISEIETPDGGLDNLRRLTETQRDDHNHCYKGFNLLAEEDSSLLRFLLQGEMVIHGVSNKLLRQFLPDKNSGQITRLLKRLRVHGLLKQAGKCYRYYLTDFGRQAAAVSLKLREMVVIPALAHGKT